MTFWTGSAGTISLAILSIKTVNVVLTIKMHLRVVVAASERGVYAGAQSKTRYGGAAFQQQMQKTVGMGFQKPSSFADSSANKRVERTTFQTITLDKG